MHKTNSSIISKIAVQEYPRANHRKERKHGLIDRMLDWSKLSYAPKESKLYKPCTADRIVLARKKAILLAGFYSRNQANSSLILPTRFLFLSISCPKSRSYSAPNTIASTHSPSIHSPLAHHQLFGRARCDHGKLLPSFEIRASGPRHL